MNDLEWLARNEHKWVLEDDRLICKGTNWKHHPKAAFVGPEAGCYTGVFFSKQQWLDERARIQNKPSWDDAPDWAMWLLQLETGRWHYWLNDPNGSESIIRKLADYMISKQGEVLGNWQDTLEKRPYTDIKEMAARMAPGRIEIVDEEAMAAKYAKNNPKWNGEGLPPVGTECEYFTFGRWEHCDIIAYHKGESVAYVETSDCYYSSNESTKFRPTETQSDEEDAIYDLKVQSRFDEYDAAENILKAIKAGKIHGVKWEKADD